MNPVRVLVAEDNEDHLFLTVRAIRAAGGQGVEVEGVRDGEEALDYVFQRGRYQDRALPNLIFLDLRMPKVDGLGVLEQIKSDTARSAIPVVVLTSSERTEDIETTYRLGGNSFVTKPVESMAASLRGIADYWTGVSSLPALA